MCIFPKWRGSSQPLYSPHSFTPLPDLSLQTKVSLIQYLFLQKSRIYQHTLAFRNRVVGLGEESLGITSTTLPPRAYAIYAFVTVPRPRPSIQSVSVRLVLTSDCRLNRSSGLGARRGSTGDVENISSPTNASRANQRT